MGGGASSKTKKSDSADAEDTPPVPQQGFGPRTSAKVYEKYVEREAVRAASPEVEVSRPSRSSSKSNAEDASITEAGSRSGSKEKRNSSKQMPGERAGSKEKRSSLASLASGEVFEERRPSKDKNSRSSSHGRSSLEGDCPLALQNARAASKGAPIPIVERVEKVVVATQDRALEDIEEKFPAGEYELTLYANMARFQPGQLITFQDFVEKKTLNGTRGKCVGHDINLHVWTVHMDVGTSMRILPHAIMKETMRRNADNVHSTKPVIGFAAYGHEIVEVVLDTNDQSLHRVVKDHVVTPCISDAHVLAREAKKEEVTSEEPKAKPRKKSKAKPKKSLDDTEVPASAKEFEIDDMVTMRDAGGTRLGVGKIKEMGDKPGMVRVEFGQRGGVYNLEVGELQHWTRSRKSAVQVTQEAMDAPL